MIGAGRVKSKYKGNGTMIFKKKDKKSKPKKEKKVPVMKVGTHKKIVIALWLVLITSCLLYTSSWIRCDTAAWGNGRYLYRLQP